ncbi:MAG: KH domain-containing protein [Tissierellia bacterium]|nr:KH domain-containing protein [Tissierellia bacterium]
MVELVEYIAKSLIDHPESLKIETKQEKDSFNILLKVAPDDMGKIIGRQGKIAKAIRSILKAVSLKENTKVNLEIEELKE